MSGSAPKKPLFNRPAWAAKDTSAAAKENAIFGRHQVFDEVLELEEKKRLRREVQAKERAEKEKEKLAQTNPTGEPERKKRRISKDPPDDDSGSESGRSRTSSHSRSSTKSEKKDKDERVTRSTPRKDKLLLNGLEQSHSRVTTSPPATQKAAVIELGDDNSDDESPNAQTARETVPVSKRAPLARSSPSKMNIPQSHAEVESEDSEEDDYLRALKRKARERSRLKRLDLEQHKPSTAFAPASDERSPSIDQTRPDSALLTPSITNDPSDTFAETKHPVEDDPEVGILIKSAIPNVKPLIVNRRASQPLQQVKDFWCARQNFEPSFSAKVFFTWRGTKLFNSSTMKTVLRQLKKERGFEPDGSDDPSKGKITVEAMTEEIYQERLKAKERKLAADANSENHSETEDVPEPVPEPPKKDGIVIKLTSQGLEPMPLRVRPHTSIHKIMIAFQQQRGVDKDKTCWLVFDGEKLEKETSVEEAGFEEGDEIEVYPR